MARHNQALQTMHTIVRRNAYYQALFFFVDGVMSADVRMSPREAILIFRERFEIDDLDVSVAVTTFNRMRAEYIRNNNLFDEKQDKSTQPDDGTNHRHACHGMGESRR